MPTVLGAGPPDDMRPWFAPFTSRYGVKAPNLAKLASESLVFNNTYVQQAVCSPSRNSFLTGKRPDSTNVWTFQTSFRESGIDTKNKKGADWVTFPEVFKLNGWNTMGMGKIFHPGHPKANDCIDPYPADGRAPDCRSWTTEFTSTTPADITALGDNPMAVTTCAADACNFSYFQVDSQIAIGGIRLGEHHRYPPF